MSSKNGKAAETYKRILNRKLVQLIDDVDLLPLLDHMVSKELITLVQKRDILEAGTTSDSIRRLVENVYRRSEEEYRKFLECLRASNQEFLAKELDEEEKKLKLEIMAEQQISGQNNSKDQHEFEELENSSISSEAMQQEPYGKTKPTMKTPQNPAVESGVPSRTSGDAPVSKENGTKVEGCNNLSSTPLGEKQEESKHSVEKGNLQEENAAPEWDNSCITRDVVTGTSQCDPITELPRPQFNVPSIGQTASTSGDQSTVAPLDQGFHNDKEESRLYRSSHDKTVGMTQDNPSIIPLEKCNPRHEQQTAGETPVTQASQNVTQGGQTPVTQGGQTPVTQGGQTPVTQSGQIPVTQGGQILSTQSGQIPVTQSGQIPVTQGVQTPVTQGGQIPLTQSGQIPVTHGGQQTPPVQGGNSSHTAKPKSQQGMKQGEEASRQSGVSVQYETTKCSMFMHSHGAAGQQGKAGEEDVLNLPLMSEVNRIITKVNKKTEAGKPGVQPYLSLPDEDYLKNITERLQAMKLGDNRKFEYMKDEEKIRLICQLASELPRPPKQTESGNLVAVPVVEEEQASGLDEPNTYHTQETSPEPEFMSKSYSDTVSLEKEGSLLLKRHFDVCMIFAPEDEDKAEDLKNYVEELTLESGDKPQVILFEDTVFGAAKPIQRLEVICKHCTLLFVMISQNFRGDFAKLIEENVVMKSTMDDTHRIRPVLADRADSKYIPLHMLNLTKIELYRKDIAPESFKKKMRALIELQKCHRLKRESNKIQTLLG